jgi:hypothetical protein
LSQSETTSKAQTYQSFGRPFTDLFDEIAKKRVNSPETTWQGPKYTPTLFEHHFRPPAETATPGFAILESSLHLTDPFYDLRHKLVYFPFRPGDILRAVRQSG